MARRLKLLPSFSNVAAGNTATLALPKGNTYNSIMLKYEGVTLAQLKNLKMLVGGKVFQTYADGVELDGTNTYYGRGAAENGFIVLHFNRPELANLAQSRLFGLGTADVTTLDFTVDIDAAAADPKLTAWALESEKDVFGVCTKIKRFPVSYSSGGIKEIDNLPVPASARIAAIHLMTDKVDHAELEVNGNIAFEAPKLLEQKIQKDAGRTPSDSRFVMDFIKESDWLQSQVLAGVEDFRVRINVTEAAGASFFVVVEYLDGKDGI